MTDLSRSVMLMRASPRCGAQTRQGTPCRAPAVKGKLRCRMHGGANGSGAPIGNANALKHGEYAKATIEMRKKVAALTRRAKAILDRL